MTLARVKSISLSGLKGEIVDIEVDISDGLPGYSLLGLPDAALLESRERVRSALLNSGAPWPNQRVTVSLSPAWLHKSGSGFDLPIAIALLLAQGILESQDLSDIVFLGELALDGSVKPIRGILPALLAAAERGVHRALIPRENFSEATGIERIKTIAISHLHQAIAYINEGEIPEEDIAEPQGELVSSSDLSDVVGQRKAKYALEMAAIGGHHLLLIGPPGTGKSQTIANLIASLAAASKRVLFVAEKRAALEVVQKRLKQVGLEHIAIDLHGADVSPKRVMEQVGADLTGVY